MKKEKKYSLLTVIAAVTLVVVILVLVLMMTIVRRSTVNLEEYILSRQSAEMISTSGRIEQDMDALYLRLYAELVDESLTKIRLYMEEGLYNAAYYDLTRVTNNRLLVFEQSQNLARNLVIYLPGQQYVITSGSVLRMTQEQRDKLQKICQTENKRVALVDDELVFVVSRAVGNFRQEENRVYGMVRLTQSAMREYLGKYIVHDNGQTALFVQTPEGMEYFVGINDEVTGEEQSEIARIIANSHSGMERWTQDGTRNLITWMRVGQSPLLLCYRIPMEIIDGQMSEFITFIVVVLAIVLLLMMALVAFLYSVMLRPQRCLRQAFQWVEEGNLASRLNGSTFEEYERMYAGFNHMADRLQHLIEREYELNLLNVKAQINEMRYQINPHFLYNTYFNLRAMLIDEDYDQAAQLADLLGRYLHYITASSQEEAYLKEEMTHCMDYMNIQQMRFARRVRTRMEECPAQALERKVPRLIVQPLIENAYTHGMKLVNSEGFISVRVQQEDQRLSIFVEDNGTALTDEKIEQICGMITSALAGIGTDGLALRNIHRRLVLLYAKGSGLYLTRSQLGGLCAEIRIMEEKTDVSDAHC